MFELLTPTKATLTSVTPRTEVHGEERVFAISLGLKFTGPNTLLDKLDSTLRHALYMPVPDQENLPGIEQETPLLRSKLVEEVKIGPASFEGWTLAVDHGIDESEPITIGGCKVDKFRCVPSDGGTVELMFRVGSNDIDATEAGLLCSHLGHEISVTLTAPKKPADAIDGTTEAFKKDHPDAGDLFVAGHSDPGDDDGEGSDIDADGAWTFPRDGASGEAPPESVTTESATRSPAGSRTARGRERTAKALAEGAAS